MQGTQTTAQKEKTNSAMAEGSFLVVNLRGLVNTNSPVRSALEQLSLIRRFNATIVPKNDMYLGLLRLAKEHVAWCSVDSAMVEKLLKKRAEVSDRKKFEEADVSKSGYSSLSELAQGIANGKTRLDGSQGMRKFFRLSPPKGGFKRSTRRQFGEGGILGLNPDLPEIVDRML